MPEITLKNHQIILPKGDLRDDGYIFLGEKELMLPKGLAVKYENFSSVESDQGRLSITSNDQSIGLLEYTIVDIPVHDAKVAQISSVYVKPKFQFLGVGPSAYEYLISQVPVVSDTLQTEAGAILWAVTLASNPNIKLNIIDSFGSQGETLRVDHKQKIVEYTYEGQQVHSSSVWGLGHVDPRFDIEVPFEVSFENTNRDVVLIATPADVKDIS